MRQEPSDQHAALTVERRDPADVRIRQVVVSLDGAPFATLLFGDTATRAISPGPHRLRVHNTLVWKTVQFDALSGEHVRFRTVNRAGPVSMALVALLGAGPLYISVDRVADGSAELNNKDRVNGSA